MEIQRQISRARHEAMVGRELDVLVEGVSSESEYLLEGRWYGQAPGIDGVTYLADGQAAPGATRARARHAGERLRSRGDPRPRNLMTQSEGASCPGVRCGPRGRV